jgi:hypothetical protein
MLDFLFGLFVMAHVGAFIFVAIDVSQTLGRFLASRGWLPRRLVQDRL